MAPPAPSINPRYCGSSDRCSSSSLVALFPPEPERCPSVLPTPVVLLLTSLFESGRGGSRRLPRGRSASLFESGRGGSRRLPRGRSACNYRWNGNRCAPSRPGRQSVNGHRIIYCFISHRNAVLYAVRERPCIDFCSRKGTAVLIIISMFIIVESSIPLIKQLPRFHPQLVFPCRQAVDDLIDVEVLHVVHQRTVFCQRHAAVLEGPGIQLIRVAGGIAYQVCHILCTCRQALFHRSTKEEMPQSKPKHNGKQAQHPSPHWSNQSTPSSPITLRTLSILRTLRTLSYLPPFKGVLGGYFSLRERLGEGLQNCT